LPVIKDLREDYNKISFVNDNGALNLTPCPVIQTETLKKYGLKTDGSFQTVRKMAVYPAEFFSPKSQFSMQTRITASTYSIHQFAASWYTEEEMSDLIEFRNMIKKARMEQRK
jgi:hypothetical protein